MPLSRAVRGRLNLAIDKVEVYERNGQIGRTCWVMVWGNRDVFTYNHSSGKIELKAQSLQGALINTFDNHTSIAAIRRQSAAL